MCKPRNHRSYKSGLCIVGGNVPVCAIIRTWNWFHKSSDFGTYSGERQSYYLYSSLYQEADQYEVLYTMRTTWRKETEELHWIHLSYTCLKGLTSDSIHWGYPKKTTTRRIVSEFAFNFDLFSPKMVNYK